MREAKTSLGVANIFFFNMGENPVIKSFRQHLGEGPSLFYKCVKVTKKRSYQFLQDYFYFTQKVKHLKLQISSLRVPGMFLQSSLFEP